MLHTDIERFLGTLLYPLSHIDLLFQDPLQLFLDTLPQGFIEPCHTKGIQKRRKEVYEKAISYMEVQCQLDNYDQIQQYMERWYLGQDVWKPLKDNIQQKEGHLSVYDLALYQMKRLANSMVSKLDGKFTYKYWETKGDVQLLGGFAGQDKMHLFRGLSQLVPMDLLVAVSVLDSNQPEDSIRAFRGNVAVTDSPLEQVLQRGVAENHLHMGVSAGFSLIWEELMCPTVGFSQQVITTALPICGARALPPEKLCFCWAYARYLRIWLAAYFAMGFCNKQGETAIEELQQELFDTNGSLKTFSYQLMNPQFLQQNYHAMKSSKDAIDLFNELDQTMTAFVQQNPQLDYLRITDENNSEGVFLLRTMAALEKIPFGDEIGNNIKRLFLYYLRLKHGIFRMMVQHKAVGGLDYFQKYYRSVSGTSKFSGKFASDSKNRNINHFKRLILAQISNPHVKKVEFRTSFFDTEKKARQELKEFLTAYRDILYKYYCEKTETGYQPRTPFPKVGLVLHFLKSLQEMPDLCICGEDDSLMRFQQLKRSYNKQLEIFLRLRDPQKHPGIDHYLVGIDVASLENAVPTWVFVSAYEAARDSKREPFLLTGQVPYQSLGFTCHAGEDFRHLMSGLRRVYEAIQYLKFHAGDRIGHGLALGVDVEIWCQNHPNVVLPRMEALENYLWAYKMLSTYPSNSNSGDLLYLEKRIHCLSEEIFCSKKLNRRNSLHIPTSVLLQSYEKLFEEVSPEEYCNQCTSPEDRENCCLKGLDSFTCSDVLKTYHCSHFACEMNQVIHYHLSPQEIAVLKTLQQMMQELVSRAGVVVEINPSSNVIIGPMDTIHQHPLYQISSYQCDYKDLMVCVNSDDPGVFQTNICNELGISYMGMVERGIGREACLAWVERLRENGMSSSFIRNRDSNHQILQTLENLIDTL